MIYPLVMTLFISWKSFLFSRRILNLSDRFRDWKKKCFGMFENKKNLLFSHIKKKSDSLKSVIMVSSVHWSEQEKFQH